MKISSMACLMSSAALRGVAAFSARHQRRVRRAADLSRPRASTAAADTKASPEDSEAESLIIKPKTHVLSGVQPTGKLTLGNYLGAIRQWVGRQMVAPHHG